MPNGQVSIDAVLRPAAEERERRRNLRAVFVLAPPGSGAEVLHRLLGAHPGLFVAADLELLPFITLAERRRVLSEPDGSRLAGALEAVRGVCACDAPAARGIVESWEREEATALDVYAQLQTWLGDRILVDGTASYALDPAALERAEAAFEDAFFVHLVRHPHAVVRSMEREMETRGLDPLPRHREHSFSRRELAELVWTISHQNVVELLARVPAARRHRLRFEDLLADPAGELWALCRALGLAPEAMEGIAGGAWPSSGGAAETLAPAEPDGEDGEDFLGEVSWELAAGFGYRREAGGWDSIEAVRREPGAPQAPSFAQERLWVLDQLEPGGTAYNIPLSLRFRGALDRGAFGAALGEIVRRHEALRTRFEVLAGRPVQVVSPSAPPRLLTVASLEGLPAARRWRELERLSAEEAARPFDLARGPLLRAGLIEIDRQDQAFLLTLHHIVSDGWSMGVLVSELAALYDACSRGARSPLAELPVQYADYARWQRRRLSGERLQAELAFWCARLRDLPPLELPTDRPRRSGGAAPGRLLPAAIPARLADGMKALARRQGATPFVALLAAVDALLGRYTGEEDVRVGSPLANRNRVELEGMVGFFTNTLVLRTDLAGEPTFTELLERVKRTVFEAHVHQELPFEKLVSVLQPERDLSRTPLFQVMLALQNPAAATPALPGLTIEPLAAHGAAAKFDLTIVLGEGDLGMSGFVEYDAGLFHASTIRRLLGHLERLLAAAVADPSRPVAELSILSPAERHELLAEWNDTRTPVRGDLGLHQLFERQAAETPEAVAVIAGGERATYGELDRRANRLAHLLARRGVGPEVRVGVLCDRSLAMVVALLGTLKAGGAYVPLDPGYPEERLHYILRDARVALLLTAGEPTPAARFPETAVVDLAAAAAELAAMPQSALAPGVTPRNLAYLIYTSGSTGRPKGVAVAHRSAVERMWWAREEFSRQELAGVLAATSLCFDLSVFELFAPLCWGGAAILAESISALPALAAASGVTLVNTVPSAMAALLDGPLPPSLRAVALAGEPLTDALAARIHRSSAGARLRNLYGPSEDTTYSTGARIGAGDRLSIGRPLPAGRAHVLDRASAPLPIGIPGELHLAGDGLARGYLDRPELTAASFVPDPFAAAPGGRLYRTGDRARRLPDGRLEFLGRVDHQVKLRGFRIELGEVEAALASHPEVAEAIVVLREGASGGQALAAYATSRRGTLLDAGEILAFLRRRLPEPMVPASVTQLAEPPRLPNGKVDRRSLPAPTLGPAAAYAAPRGAIEERLAEIWRALLRVDRVGVHDNFFELGGDSILAIQVAFRADREGLHLTARQLFDRPTIAQLAPEVGAAVAAPEPPPIGPVPLTPIQQWFFAQDLTHREHFNQALLVDLSPAGAEARIDPFRLRRSLTCLLARHDALRMRFLPPAAERTAWRQLAVPPIEAAPPCLLHVDLAALPGERRAAAEETVAEILQASFDLERGRLFAAAFFSGRGAEPDRLLLACHHLAVDGVSWRILLDELAAVYELLARGASPVLASEATPFAHWAARLEVQAASPAAQREAPFWLAQLDGAAATFPADLAAGENDVASSREVTVGLDGESTRALLQAVPRAYRTRINDALLAALARALAGRTGRRRHVIDLEGHGREEIGGDVDLTRTVGWFTALFPIALDLDAGAGPAEALKAVKEQLRSIPGNGLGYGLLAAWGEESVRAALRAHPAPVLVFNYLGQLDGPAGEGFLRLAPGPVGALRHPGQRRSHLLEVTASVAGGRLRASFTYSANRHLPAAVAALGEAFRQGLEELIDHCRSPGAGGYTPSDFPLARLSQAELDALVAAAGGEIDDIYPASPVQQGMLFHSMRAGGSGVYVGQTSVTFERGLDLAAFARAWDETAAAHPILRTAFLAAGRDELLQVVHRRVELAWDHRDWRGMPGDEQRQALAELLREDRRRGFDPARPPLQRFALIRLADDACRFVWSVHHALFDGWSVPILLRELFARYRGAGEGLGERAGPAYRDYVAWLIDQDLGSAERFWRSTLAGFAAPTPLLLDRAAPPQASAAPGQGAETAMLSGADTLALQLFARRHGLTLNTLAQGAWGLLLHRYAGGDDIVFGAVTSGRSAPVPGIEEMVGLFINTLPVRLAIDSAASPASWLLRLQERQAEARHFEHTPLSLVHRWSEVGGGVALFESILVFENYPADEAVREQIDGSVRATGVEVREQTNYPLTLAAGGDSRLGLKLLYDAGRLDPLRAARMLRHFVGLLAGMTTAPALAAIPLLTPVEVQQVREWGRGAAAPAPGGAVIELFERIAARSAGRPAIRFEDRVLVFGELDGRANQLARLLRRRGSRPGSFVGLAAERSPDLVIGLLGLWKAGCAYVPLDPAYPAARLASAVDDCGLQMLIASGPGLAGPAATGVRILHLEADRAAIDAESREPLGERIEPRSLAYTIYTSGSTGRPKGVCVEHASLAAILGASLAELGWEAGDRALCLAPLSFDIFLFELLSPLLAGGLCTLVPLAPALDLDRLIPLLADVTRLHAVPALMRQVVERVGRGGLSLPALRTLFVGGDEVPLDLLQAMRRVFPAAEIRILYGPTEATILCSSSRLAPGEEPSRSAIGRPLPAAEIVLCDPRGRPVPAGVPGEVWIGGAGVSRGYLGAPELTAERFPEVGGSRFYRSGDLARWLEDGELQFLGRTDRQVKIRGFRIEPAEIEGALRAHPQVREAAVAAHGTPERRHLVAYLVAAGGEPPAAPALRTFLRARLPEHMIPAAFVPLAALPLSANGKIDRGALPPPDARPEAAYVAPRSAVERVLAAIWGRLLEVDRVGATDDFFALGGHSLVATQIVSRVRRTFRIDLPLGSFFAATTVAELAALVVALEPRPGVAEAIALALQAARSGPPPSGEPPRPGAGGEA